MRAIYIADDGKEFSDRWECEHYEWLLDHQNLKYVRCYDKDGNRLEDIMAEHTYNYVEKILVSTDEAAKDLQVLAEYTGWGCYESITESGTWEFKVDGWNGKFVKVE